MLWCVVPLAVIGAIYGALFWWMAHTVADAPTQ
jgi:hypothetical protein